MFKKIIIITISTIILINSISAILDLYSAIADNSYIPQLLENKNQIDILSNYSDLYTKTTESLNKIQSEIDKTQEKLESLGKQKTSLQREIDTFDTKIELLEKQKEEVDIKINETNKVIEDIEQKIALYETKQKEYENISQQLLKIMNKETMESIAGLLLKSDNLSDFVMTMRSSSLLEQQGRKTIEEMVILKARLNQSKQLLIINQQQNKKYLSELESLDQDLTTQKHSKLELLKLTQGDENIYNNLLGQAIKQQEEIRQTMTKIEEDFAKTHSNIGIKLPESHIEEENLFEYNVYLNWPVEYRPINFTAFFHDDDYKELFGFAHDAVDIKLAQGSPVLSACDGYIFEAKDNDMGYSYIIIAHTNGIFTLYGHINEILVKQGDIISKGQLIAKSGGMPGTKGAGPFTTGPHLHFEVHYAGQAQDPIMFLDIKDISIANIPDTILNRYKTRIKQMMIKYPFTLIGTNDTERRDYLLQTYAQNDFKDKNLWISTAILNKIDPDLLVCIGFAETTLGNYMKSINNVGNVGNNDRGDTVIYPKATDGIQAIAQTLNNSYLGQYNTIGELSRWGNKTGPIYASSSRSWFINVSKCMSAIKGGFVDEDYEFRTK